MDRRTFRMLRHAARRPRTLAALLGYRLFLPLFKRRTTLPVSPLVLDIEPTVRCNLRCAYCQVSDWSRSGRVGDLTYERFVHVVEQFPHLLWIKLQGMGEPFLNRDFFRMLEFAEGRGILVRTVTNATTIDEALAERIVRSPLAELTVSIDGGTRETYQRIRRGASFDRVVENVGRLVETRRRLGNGKDPVINIWMVGTTENIAELPRLVELGGRLGVDRVYLQPHLNYWGQAPYQRRLRRYSINREPSAAAFAPEVERVIAAARRAATETGTAFAVNIGNTLAEGQKCDWPWTSAYVSADGFVVPCCMVANPEVAHLGNVFDSPLKTIWNGPRYQALRQQFLDGAPPPMCDGCYLRDR